MFTKLKDSLVKDLPKHILTAIIGMLSFLLAVVWTEIFQPLIQIILPVLSKKGLMAIIAVQLLLLVVLSLYILLSRKKVRHYRFDKRLGIYFHKKTNDPYCPSCLVPDNIESPLHESKNGWYCQRVSCDKFFNNPDSKEKPQPPANWKIA